VAVSPSAGSGLLLLEDLHTLLGRLDAVLERLAPSGDLLEVLGRRPRLLDRRLERLYSPLESPLTSAERRHTALRRFLAELALATVDAIREPLDAYPTCVPVGIASVIEQRPQRDGEGPGLPAAARLDPSSHDALASSGAVILSLRASRRG
jgi:hypothetical protein